MRGEHQQRHVRRQPNLVEPTWNEQGLRFDQYQLHLLEIRRHGIGNADTPSGVEQVGAVATLVRVRGEAAQ